MAQIRHEHLTYSTKTHEKSFEKKKYRNSVKRKNE